MMLRKALRMLRSEAGLTQTELASAVYVSFSTVNRWENQGMRPNRLQSKALLDLAKARHVSAACLEALNRELMASRADDKTDRARMQQDSEDTKLAQHDLLTAEQFRKTMDNIDMALIGQRFYGGKPESCDIFYQNNYFIRSLGYAAEEYGEKVRRDPFFAIAPGYRAELLRRFGALLSHQMELGDFSALVKAVRKDQSEFWLEIRAASLTEYSYGQELFTSCRDVSKRVEAERRCKEEILLREVSMQVMFSNIHCDLTDNKVTRQHNLSPLLGAAAADASFDQLIALAADAAPDGPEKDRFLASFSRDALLAAFARGDVYGNIVLYNKNTRRWFRNEHLVVKNPVNGHIYALIYVFDIQKQVLSERMLKIFLDQFFDFVGLIDTDTGLIEPYYYAEGVFREQHEEKRDYAALCAEKFRLYGSGGSADAQGLAVDLRTVRARLERAAFYSVKLRLTGYDAQPLLKKITFTYLDASRDTIIVAQSDLTRLISFAHGRRMRYRSHVVRRKTEERHEQR